MQSQTHAEAVIQMEPLCSDSDLAAVFRMSPEWVRKQRMYRRLGRPHVLTIDPVMITPRSPRYRRADVQAWLEEQCRLSSINKK
jgi:hypothetical protein